MAVSILLKNKHLLSRAGFGISLYQIARLETQKPADFLKEILAQKLFEKIKVIPTEDELDYASLAKLGAEDKKIKLNKNRQGNINLNLGFLQKMVDSENQLNEKMAFFWNGHFATRIINAQFNQDLLQTIRENALGNFGDLLKAVSKSPSMLQFLNNQQNRKNHPNENFAREVMELFTLGRGNYSEKDIQEAARAFTGWGYDKDGNFKERKNLHDAANKTFLGKSGNFTGGDILDIILSQKATARFITTKIYKFFVNDLPDELVINDLSEKFFNSNYDIKVLMTEIFSADWFYSEKNIGAKIKSPVELLVGMMRILPTTISNPKPLITYQKLLGQLLLYPPNVAGWPTGKSWIDSSTLLLRMQLPQIWTGLRPLEVTAKADDDLEMGMKTERSNIKNPRNRNFTVNWTSVEEAFKDRNVAEILLQKNMKDGGNFIKQFSDGSTKLDIINVMSVPEYQLC